LINPSGLAIVVGPFETAFLLQLKEANKDANEEKGNNGNQREPFSDRKLNVVENIAKYL
jgi:hypothetical protein